MTHSKAHSAPVPLEIRKSVEILGVMECSSSEMQPAGWCVTLEVAKIIISALCHT